MKCYKSKSFRQTIHDYNVAGLLSIPTKKKSVKILNCKIKEVLQMKMDAAPKLARSSVLNTALKALDKSQLTKQQLYQAVGWKTLTTPLNSHWPGYYYALRREGCSTTLKDQKLWFHLGDFDESVTVPKMFRRREV